MIKGILFDFDGTLSNRVESAYYMYRYLLHDMFPELNVHSAVFEGRVQRCMLWDEFGTINKRHVLEMIKKKWKEDLDVEHYVKVWYETFHLYQVEQPGAYDVLLELSKKYKLGIVTNGNGLTQGLKIDELDLRKYFDTVIVSGDFGSHKPSVDIYHQAAKDLGLEVEEIAFVGDTFDTDILGAIDVGMLPIWYCYEHLGVTVYPVPIVHNYEELKEMFLIDTEWNK